MRKPIVDLDHPCFCHCQSCRRASGAPFVAWGTCAKESFDVTHGELRYFHSSPPVTRGVCSRCGTSITYAHEARPGSLDVTLATLNQPESVRPDCHIWIDDKLEWLEINDGLPQYGGWRSDG
ncbi:MAG: GFA family protein [Gammaproteobacteria bacterium]